MKHEQQDKTVKLNEFVPGELYMIRDHSDRKMNNLVGKFVRYDEEDSGIYDDAEGMLIFRILGKFSTTTNVSHEIKMMKFDRWTRPSEVKYEVMRVGEKFWYQSVQKFDPTYFTTRPLIVKTRLPDDISHVIDSFVYNV